MRKHLAIISFFFFPLFPIIAQEHSYQAKEQIAGRLELTAIPEGRNANRITVEWKTTVTGEDHFFSVERSFDGKTFETIGILKSRAGQQVYFFTDERPSIKNNHYRIKISTPDGETGYSKIHSCSASTEQFCKFYPNPVEKFLIVRSESIAELRITDPSGKVRINRQIEAGLQLVEVSSLEKGLYIITIYHKGSNRVITDKLIKS